MNGTRAPTHRRPQLYLAVVDVHSVVVTSAVARTTTPEDEELFAVRGRRFRRVEIVDEQNGLIGAPENDLGAVERVEIEALQNLGAVHLFPDFAAAARVPEDERKRRMQRG